MINETIIIHKDNKSPYKVTHYEYNTKYQLHYITAYDTTPTALDKFTHTFVFTELEYKNITYVR